MFDRILLFLLVLLLPLGIIASRIISGDLKIPNKNAELQEKKIEALIGKLSAQTSAPPAESNGGGFNVTGVIYASSSAILKVAAVAPKPAQYVWIWMAGVPKSKSGKAASASAVQQIDSTGPYLINPSSGGSFVHELDMHDYEGVVEVRLEQGNSRSTVRFDLDHNKQLN